MTRKWNIVNDQSNANYDEITSSLGFYSKDIADNNFKSFEYKAKLVWNTEADGANGILKDATIAVPSNV